MAEERINDLPKAECSKPPCPTDEEAAQAVAVTDAVLTAATKRDVAGVCEHASDTLLKLISDDPETPVSQAECAAWVPGNIDSYGNPPPPGGYTIPRIGFQQMGDGGTDRRWSAYVYIEATDSSAKTATVKIRREEDGVWRVWQCCDFVLKTS